ncbi:hypothetical protein Ddye_019570 [Dipteronia dyeriana]|uniref:BZIP domain-containing protein n=1 Tax=Dipteronia dyeriana TaxID=168575 RepID=A0AAD9TY62_9ROSI|nr:hypothetical protein Ddye_019570 [Dipteronia dyeriana]
MYLRSSSTILYFTYIYIYTCFKLMIAEDSDEDLLTVPDVEASPAMDSTNKIQNQKRRKGRNPVDKEYRRIKRLLRNRVSAQQARERKKVYVNELESRAKELQDLNSKLEETISTLNNENTMLRKVLLSTRPKLDHTTSTTVGQKHHI